MKKKIKKLYVNLKSSLDHQISPNKQKILGTVATIPLIAAGTMSGACAGGCPFGLVNDPFPGQCSRFTDLNSDGICDLSQSVTTTLTTDSATTPSSDSSTTTQTTDSNANGAHGSQNIDSDSLNADIIQDPNTGSLDSNPTPIDANDYHMLPISLLIIGGYLFTYYLFKKGILKSQKHQRIWNLLLMAGYLGTGVTGILLTFMINLGISIIYNPSLTYWHAEMSILMVIGTLAHIHIYKKPFKNMFKVLFGFKLNSKKNTNMKRVSS